MTEVKGVRLPAWYNGIGVHDTCGCNAGVMNYEEARAYGADLLDHGITFYKILAAGTNKVEMARGLVDAGLLVAGRFYVYQPWGQPPASWVTPRDQVEPYAAVGVQLFELGWNEANIADEWHNLAIPKQAYAIADAVIAAWQVGLAGAGAIPGVKLLFPSMTPGGHVDHRWVYNEIVAKLRNKTVREAIQELYRDEDRAVGVIDGIALQWGFAPESSLIDTVEHVACHPRPHNNPPDTTWTATNTVTFDEWRWIRDKFNNGCYLWATEHGYSLHDDQNTNYPQIDLTMWTEYNWLLFKRMNQAEVKAIEPQLAGVAYWLIQDFGAFNSWEKDCLLGSEVPEMPNPSPLWRRMGEQVEELEFNRYDGAPPVVDRARGFDCSSYQGDINWPAVAGDFSFVFIRASAGATPDPWYAQNYDAAHEQGLLVGAYHYLTQADSGQAKLFFETCGDRVPELGYYGDLEANDLTGDKCALFLATMDGWIADSFGGLAGVYTRASFFDRFGVPAWTVGRPLWVAHWGVTEPTLPAAWHHWEFWQTGQGPVAGQAMDLDEYNGTVDDLLNEYVPEEPPEEPDMQIIDITGAPRNWAWIQATYGEVEILPADGYRVVKLVEVEGIMGFTCTLLNEQGGPVAGQQVAYVTPTQEYIEITRANGVAEHIAGPGEGYTPPGPGPVSWYVKGAESERITGLGWLLGSNHRHLQVTMQLQGDEPPEPPSDFEAQVLEKLDRIIELLEGGE